MALFDIGVPFTEISSRVLELRSKASLIAALRLYGDGYLERALQGKPTPYQRRQHQESLKELQYRGILSETQTDIPEADKIAIPTNVEYDTLSLIELKVLIAAYQKARRKRSPYFVWTATHREIAAAARLPRESVTRALFGLRQKRLVKTEKERGKGVKGITGTTITLLCPESSASFNAITWFYIDRRNELTAPVIYKMALENYDPTYELEHTFGYYDNVQTLCPFCLKKTFRFTATETVDQWHCFSCKLKGDSARLFARMLWQPGKGESFRITSAKILEIVRNESQEDVCKSGC